MNRKLAAVAVGVALALAGGTAHATTPKTVVRVYLANDTRNPNLVTTTCTGGKPTVNTVVFNDNPAATGPEIVQIYKEVGALSNYPNWPVVVGPYLIPLGHGLHVALPYGPTYNAVAIPAGNDPKTGKPYTFPKTPNDFFTMAIAGTADNSQLFPPNSPPQLTTYEYPAAPIDCTQPTGTPTTSPTTKNCDNGSPDETCPSPCPTVTTPPVLKAVTVPTCPPTSTSSTQPSTSSPPTVPNSNTAPPTGTQTFTPLPSSSSTSPSPTGPTLAHTGASVVPLATGAVLLGAAGVGLVVGSRRLRRH